VAADDAALHLVSLSRGYGKVRAVDNFTLDIPGGRFVTLLGPSGCGKTTTLNLVAGLDQPDAGQVFLGGEDVTHLPPNERRMAMVFQNYALYPHMSVFENIGFSLRLQRRPTAEIARRVGAIAEVLDIDHLLSRRPGQLSGGQQQRVAVGRALVKEPLVFLLDEPFSNLDAALRSRMRTEVKHLHLRLGTTSVLVTHDQEEAMTLSDLIAVMRDGQLVQFGSPREIYAHPANSYVATFVGKPKMSLIEGVLEDSDGGVLFVAPGIRVYLGSRATMRLREGSSASVLLGVRAEDVQVQFGGSTTEAGPAFEVRVELIEPVGSDTFLELAAGAQTLVARVPPDVEIELGDRVMASLVVSRIHLFAANSGERINW
jgi:ABC-type sugar transport system ATPase subunit